MAEIVSQVMLGALAFLGGAFVILLGHGRELMLYLIIFIALAYKAWRGGGDQS